MGKKVNNIYMMNTLDFYHISKINEFASKKQKFEEQLQLTGKDSPEFDEILKQILLTNQEEEEYYLLVMELLCKYYNLLDNPVTETKQNGLRAFLNIQSTIDKTQLLHEYLFRVHATSKPRSILYGKGKYKCSNCEKSFTFDSVNCSYVCEHCGCCTKITVHSEKAPFRQQTHLDQNAFSYRRYDHFVEWLNKFHNRNKSKVPVKVIENVRQQLARMKITKPNRQQVLGVLKKLNERKYSSQTLQILQLLDNQELPKIPYETQQKMKTMFKAIQDPFEQVCPVSRTNFLSYSYVIRKFLELLGKREYCKYFPLLKSREKLHEQDLIWKKICKVLGWKYYESI